MLSVRNRCVQMQKSFFLYTMPSWSLQPWRLQQTKKCRPSPDRHKKVFPENPKKMTAYPNCVSSSKLLKSPLLDLFLHPWVQILPFSLALKHHSLFLGWCSFILGGYAPGNGTIPTTTTTTNRPWEGLLPCFRPPLARLGCHPVRLSSIAVPSGKRDADVLFGNRRMHIPSVCIRRSPVCTSRHMRHTEYVRLGCEGWSARPFRFTAQAI